MLKEEYVSDRKYEPELYIRAVFESAEQIMQGVEKYITKLKQKVKKKAESKVCLQLS